MNHIFTYNPTTFMVDLDKDYISTIKEFKAILVRDKGVKGDTQGRKKLQAQKEFTFIYHYCDYRSKFINYSEKDRRINALTNAELDPKLNIEKDEELAAAIDVYLALQDTPSLKMLISIKEGLHTSIKVVDKVRKDLDKALDEADLTEYEEEVKGKKVMVDPLDRITKRLKSLTEIANSLPTTLKTIEDLEEKVKLQMGDAPSLRGKVEKGFTEDMGSSLPKAAGAPSPIDEEDEE